MKLLLITQYFPPEIGAPQNRLYELSIRLMKKGYDITVLTAMPNYPKMEIHDNYRDKKYVFENIDGIKVHRSYIYVSKSRSISKRLRNYFSFTISSYRIGKRNLDDKYDIIFCESPPLFLGISAYYLSKKKKAKFIFNVSDLWPESAEKLGLVKNRLFLKSATILEEFLYKKADLITGQTKGIVANVSRRFPHKKIKWLPNGVDIRYYDPNIINQNTWREKNGFKSEEILFYYGGIIGHAQGLEIILLVAEKLKEYTNIHFILQGNGPEKQYLEDMSKKLNLKTLHFFDSVEKNKMPIILKSVDCSIIPLKKLDLFLGAIPSKIFESLAMKIPILLGVDGEAKSLFIDNGKCGIYFEPENKDQLLAAILKLSKDPKLRNNLGENGRKYVEENFNRDQISNNFKNEIEQLF